MVTVILMALAPVFFVLGLGYAAGRRRMVDNQHIDGFNVLVMSFALPASLFAATASAPREQMLEQAPLFFISGAVMLAVWAISYTFRRKVAQEGSADASLQALTIAYPNLAGVGLPIVAAVLGPAGVVPVAVTLAAGSILVTPLTLILVEMSRKDGATNLSNSSKVRKALWRAVTRPVVVAPAAGILISLCGLPLNGIIAACLTLIGHAAAGVALFLTGLILSAQSFRMDGKVLSATAMADLFRPLLAAGLVALLPVSHETAKTAILLAAVPSGFFGILFAVTYRQDSATPGSMVLASTVFSIVPLTIAIAVLFPR